MDTQLVVLGGGPGGYAAAFLAADLGMQVTLVDREPRLGGVCLLRGCIPSKALLHVAKAMADARRLAEWGVSFPEPKLSLDAMRARKDKVIATLTGGLAQLAKKRNVRLVRAKPSSPTRSRSACCPPAARPWRTIGCASSIASSPPAPARRGSRFSICPPIA